jgi:hypothetical protein
MRAPMSALLATLALIASPALAQQALTASPPPARADLSASALTLGRAVADWQLRHMDGKFEYVQTHRPGTLNPRGWIQGAFYVGLTAFAERTGDLGYAQALRAHGVEEGWGLGKRPLHADDHVIAQSWLWVNARDHDPAQIAPVKARFDAILADPPKADLTFIDGTEDQPCQARWCWSDALFMAPPTWIALSAATKDPRYAAYGDKEFWATTDYLLDKENGLYFRDSRFFDRRDDQGRKIFWSRGNGWVYAGVVNILKTLPANHPSRPRYRLAAAARWLLVGVAAGARAQPARDQRHGLLRLRPRLGREPGPAEGSEIRPLGAPGLVCPGQGRAARRQAGLGAAGGLRARPRRSRRHPALRLGRVPAGHFRSVSRALLAGAEPSLSLRESFARPQDPNIVIQ